MSEICPNRIDKENALKLYRSFTLIVVLLILIGLVAAPAAAQDNLYVCRDPRFATVRLEFHNIPSSWKDEDGVGWWYLADGAAMYGDTLVADAKTTPDYQLEALGIGINSAIVGKGDYSESLVGNEHSELCDPALSPIQDPDLVIVLTPEPQPVQPACPAIALNSTDNQFYCYTPGAGGVVPVPPAPKS